MISLWIIIGLIISTISVSTLAAYFSIIGLAALFSGAWLAVCAMAGSLELSKFVLAAYLHQRWSDSNKLIRTYMVFAIVVLSLITSLGIFGFLSDAYQSASIAIETENLKLQAEKTKQLNYKTEIARLTRSVDEIPDTRISKKLKARAAVDPMIIILNKKIEDSEKQSSILDLSVLEIKKKVGPLIYISKAFKIDIDTTVKYLIFVFVLVFDPLAICLVIATTQAIDSRKLGRQSAQVDKKEQVNKNKEENETSPLYSTNQNQQNAKLQPDIVRFETSLPEGKQEIISKNSDNVIQVFPVKTEEHLIEMSYVDEQIQSKDVDAENDSTTSDPHSKKTKVG